MVRGDKEELKREGGRGRKERERESKRGREGERREGERKQKDPKKVEIGLESGALYAARLPKHRVWLDDKPNHQYHHPHHHHHSEKQTELCLIPYYNHHLPTLLY